MLVAGIDAGGSKTECIIVESKNNKILTKVVGGPANYQTVGIKKACEEVKKTFLKAKRNAELNEIPLLGIGMAGAGRKEDKKKLKNELTLKIKNTNIYLSDDAYIALLGATGGNKGIVVIAGTGSIAYGLKEAGKKIRSGGWGPLIGDEGSGFWIGIEAIKKAIKAIENRGESTLLVELLKKEFSLGNFEELIPFIYNNKLPRKKIAKLVPEIFKLAQKGDHVSKLIVQRAINELISLSLSVVKKLDYKENKIAVSGGLFNSKYFYNLYKKQLKKDYSLKTYKAKYSAAYGAVFFALKQMRSENNV
ncbi:MAG: BadF/BadG/BcrA/BcrD ATPase family protein [Bacillota bacterium]